MARSTIEDDRWALNHLTTHAQSVWSAQGVSSYRYADAAGLVHRAIWTGVRWTSTCDETVTEKLQEDDPGSLTCVQCLGNGG